MAERPLPRAFYARPTLQVAADLIGQIFVHASPDGRASGRIVEVEAYVGESDPACHAAAGFTARNAPLYGHPGRAYVYLNYGMHYLVNAVTECEGAAGAVLVRALEPLTGLTLMRQRRVRGKPLSDDALCRGPGNVSRSLGVSLAQNRADLSGSRLFIAGDAVGRANGAQVVWGPRVGIRVGTDRNWRCYLADSRCVSSLPRQRL